MKTKGLMAIIAVGMLSAGAMGQRILDSMFDLNPGNAHLTSPITTFWQELVPNTGNVYHLSSWSDNGDGYLSSSDIIDITNSATGEVTYWHVDLVTITIFLTKKTPDGGQGIADWNDPSDLNQGLYNPVSTIWDWLPPNSGQFHLSSWDDNGDHYLSASDQIDITEIGGTVSYWHVDRVAMDIFISPEPSTYAAIGTGLLGLLAMRRRRK